MDDEKIVVSFEFLDTFFEDLKKVEEDFVKCINKPVKVVNSRCCDSCNKVVTCPLFRLSTLVAKIGCIVSGDVNEWD